MSAYTPEEIQQLLDSSAQEQNILPITSRCDSHCIFCSHRNNPPQVRVISIGQRTLEQAAESISFLRGDREITIGESASSVIEGEPTLHPQFKEILALVRKRFPHTPIAVTTNGHHLTEELVSFLAANQPILINLSLNSCTEEGRGALMGDTPEQAQTAIHGVELLQRYGVPFNGSMVGMPNVVGYENIAATIRYLAEHGAGTVSIFTPGFSKWVKKEIFPDAEGIHRQLKEFLERLSDDLPCPVLLEPSFVTDLDAVVSGVAKDAPAWRAGVRRGDRLTLVNGTAPRSRTEAFQLLSAPGTVRVKAQRGQKHLSFAWNTPDGNSGITMQYDFDMNRAAYIRRTVETAPGHVLALTSEFGHQVFLAAMDKIGLSPMRYTAVAVENHTFGGTIRASGLLTCQDYLDAFAAYVDTHPKPGAVILPGESFNALGRDLTGCPLGEIARRTGVPAALV